MSKKILILSKEFPPFLGGAATYARNLAAAIAQSGTEVTLVTCSHKAKQQQENVVDNALSIYPNLHIIRVPFVTKIYLWLLAKKCKKLLRNSQFDGFIIADSGAKKAAALFLPTTHCPTIAVFQGSDVGNYFNKQASLFTFFRLDKRMDTLLKNVSACVTVSHDLKDRLLYFKPNLANKTHVIHHGINTELFHSVDPKEKEMLRSSANISQSDFIIFSAGRLITEKGHDVLISIMEKITESYANVKLLIGGDGPQKEELQQLIIKKNLHNHIKLLGPLNQPQMIQHYQMSDIFVLLSRIETESFGLVYLEANACGRAVVGGNVGGVKEAVADKESGFLVPPKNESIVYQNIATLIDQAAIRQDMERNALHRVKNNFSMDIMAQKTLGLLL